MTEQQLKEIAGLAWKGAANAFRMYPENKHTFDLYWSGAKDQFDQFLSAPSEPAETGGAEDVFKSVLPQDIESGFSIHSFDAMTLKFIIKAMTTYAAQRCAEKDREIEDLSQRLTDALDRIAF